MDLSKTYDCLLHDPLITNRTVYDFGQTAFALITDCLINHLQQVKIGSSFSFYLLIFKGFPQALQLGQMIANPGKCHILFLVSTIDYNNITLVVKNTRIKSSWMN